MFSYNLLFLQKEDERGTDNYYKIWNTCKKSGDGWWGRVVEKMVVVSLEWWGTIDTKWGP